MKDKAGKFLNRVLVVFDSILRKMADWLDSQEREANLNEIRIRKALEGIALIRRREL